jgi:hypothetical protein
MTEKKSSTSSTSSKVRPNAEQRRLRDDRSGRAKWKQWGPYLSERQWGTVREDYSVDGMAWNSLTHDQARSRAYRWGEEGIGGISDDKQRLCFALALWNEKDIILKERLFGLTNSEGNHGEDVKECYYYLDNTPTHSYMRYLYKFPQKAFPYEQLVATNRERSREEFEFELMDTGIFEEDRYFDVFITYAKESPQTQCIRIEAWNRGPDAAPIHLLPTLWFRNTWNDDESAQRPSIREDEQHNVVAHHEQLGDYTLQYDGEPELMFCENETNSERLWGAPNAHPYAKDGINEAVVNKELRAINPDRTGTKAALRYQKVVQPGECYVVNVILGAVETFKPPSNVSTYCTTILKKRRDDADKFYASIIPNTFDPHQQAVTRQSMAGMLWSKQYYSYDVARWMKQRGVNPPSRDVPRNGEWFHLRADDIISMPDKWEYPWFAAWDLAFHSVALSVVDIDLAKQQLNLMLDSLYVHPNGQIPAYEWNFSDVNPPVHAWATIFVYNLEKEREGTGDIAFLERAFHKLLLNFTWWVNRKDATGRNVFQGGFLGLDNVGVFDRSAPLPTGGFLEQADGTAWMALYSQNMLQIALELAMHDPTYEDMAEKFIEHFLWIASAIHTMGSDGMGLWDDEDGFYYDALRFDNGGGTPLRVRSIVGLLPLAAATVFDQAVLERFPRLTERVRNFLDHHPELTGAITDLRDEGDSGRRHLAVLDEKRLIRVLQRMLDEDEFLSPHGIRSMSRFHLDNPYRYYLDNTTYEVRYLPAESDSGMFGGNSNWRGPVWFPVNAILVRSLLNLGLYYGDALKVECPTGSGQMMNLFEVGQEISRRICGIFLPDANGNIPAFGGNTVLQQDEHWRHYMLFHEYFHGDNGAGLGASHQTGWTGLVAPLMLIAELQPGTPILGYTTPTSSLSSNDNKSASPKESKARSDT